MVSFCRCVFYITCSLVLAASYFFAMDYFKKLEERKARLDKYYVERFKSAYLDLLSFNEKQGEKYMVELESQAYLDGYTRADIKILRADGLMSWWEWKKSLSQETQEESATNAEE